MKPQEVVGVQRLLNGSEDFWIICEGLSECEITWEDSVVIAQVFSNLNLKDTVKLHGRSIDRPLKHVYERKGKNGRGDNELGGKKEVVTNYTHARSEEWE